MIKSIQSSDSGGIFATAENEEVAQQLSQDGDVDLFVGARAALAFSSSEQGLGEGGRREGSSGGREQDLGKEEQGQRRDKDPFFRAELC